MPKERDFNKLRDEDYFDKFSVDSINNTLHKLNLNEKISTLEILLKELNDVIVDAENQLYQSHVDSLEITIGKLIDSKGDIEGIALIDGSTPEGKLWSLMFHLTPSLRSYQQNLDKEILFWRNQVSLTKTITSDNKKSENKTSLNEIELIRWQGSETQLIYLIELLLKENFLPPYIFDERFSFISKHFLNKKGLQFKQKQLAQSENNYEASKTGKPKGSAKIEELVEKLKNK